MLVVIVWLAADVSVAVAVEDDLAARRAAGEARYVDELTHLAEWCSEQKLDDAAEFVRRWWQPAAPGTLRLVVSAAFDDPSIASYPTDTVPGGWKERFVALRRARAEELFALAQVAANAKQTTAAYGLLFDTLRENPDHEAARAALGYERHTDRWVSRYEAAQARTGHVWHDRFGWILEAHVPRYEQGERYYRARWMSAEDEALQRLKSGLGWEVKTEHFVVHTTHSLEAGVQLAARLERLYDVWRQVFVRFYATESEVARLFDGRRTGLSDARRHQVEYYRSREEYVSSLTQIEPKIAITNGYYLAKRRTAYFYAPRSEAERDDTTLYHEATHQLFAETRRAAREVGQDGNFGIVEGVACYMESLVPRADGWTLGGRESIRFQNGQYHLVNDGFYVPLAEFVTIDMNELQRDPRIAMIYAQSAGLAHFLMHYQDGRYRDALVEYLQAIYTNRDRADTLSELTGASYAELDRQYREFMLEGLAAP